MMRIPKPQLWMACGLVTVVMLVAALAAVPKAHAEPDPSQQWLLKSGQMVSVAAQKCVGLLQGAAKEPVGVYGCATPPPPALAPVDSAVSGPQDPAVLGKQLWYTTASKFFGTSPSDGAGLRNEYTGLCLTVEQASVTIAQASAAQEVRVIVDQCVVAGLEQPPVVRDPSGNAAAGGGQPGALDPSGNLAPVNQPEVPGSFPKQGVTSPLAQLWRYDPKTKQVKHASSSLCLTLGGTVVPTLLLSECLEKAATPTLVSTVTVTKTRVSSPPPATDKITEKVTKKVTEEVTEEVTKKVTPTPTPEPSLAVENQRWVFENKKIKSGHNESICLVVSGPPEPVPSGPLETRQLAVSSVCSGSESNWYWNGNGGQVRSELITNNIQLCMVSSGDRLELEECSSASDDKWTLDSRRRWIQKMGKNECLQLNLNAGGGNVSLATCRVDD